MSQSLDSHKKPQTKDSQMTFAVLADAHFNRSPDYMNSMPGPSYSLRKMSELVFEALSKETHNNDGVFINGDIVDRSNDASYQDYDRLVNQSLPKIPTYYTVGNHDVGTAMPDQLKFGKKENVLQHKFKQCYTVTFSDNIFIFVDGSVENDHTRAALGPEVREWLKSILQSLPTEQKAMIFTHHPAQLQSEELAQRHALEDGAKLSSILSSFKEKVAAVFSAHIHKEYPAVSIDGVSHISLTAVSTPLRSKGPSGGWLYDNTGFSAYYLLKINSDSSFKLERRSLDLDSLIPK